MIPVDTMGKLLNMSTINSDGFRPGMRGQAFSFNGTNSYIIDKVRGLSSISNSYTMNSGPGPRRIALLRRNIRSHPKASAISAMRSFLTIMEPLLREPGVSIGTNE